MTEARKMSLPSLQRNIAADVSAEDNGTFVFPFSSEAPVERYFGSEVLSHERGAANLDRLNDGASLLWNHDPDQVIGVVERAYIGDDRRGYAKVRFGNSSKAAEVKADVADGVIRNVSFGYRIDAVREERSADASTFTATAWTAYEVSFVAIPADASVGLGRSCDDSLRDVLIERGEDEPSQIDQAKETLKMEIKTPAPEAVDVSALRAEAAEAEKARISTINALGARFEKADLARQLIEGNRSIDEARRAFLEELGAREMPVAAPQADIKLTEKEERNYSVVKAILAAERGDWSKAGFEREISDELARSAGRETAGFYMPLSLRTTYNVGTANQGGNLVATDLMAGEFIEVLRNNAVVMGLGTRMMTGLVGNVAIPRQTSATSTYWVAENADITKSEFLLDQVTLSPKQLGARSQYSRLALQQTTPDIEALVRSDLAKVMAIGIDAAAINGTGSSGQPTGILNASGIGSVPMGTNGAALSSLDTFIDLEKALDVANSLTGSLSYLTNAKVIGAAKKLKDSNGNYLWTNDRDSTVQGTAGSVNGYSVARSNQVPSSLTKGTGTNLSALIMGDFSSLVCGFWGGLEVLPNPYGAGYNNGAVDIRAMQTVDFAVRHGSSFAVVSDIVAA